MQSIKVRTLTCLFFSLFLPFFLAEVLNAMMAERHNKMCADCGTRGPRWASTNLGCFICIRCSGIHRNMGTHISKVRSVTLDKWSKEQVDFFKNYGNKACNRYYEERLPDDFRRPNVSDDYQMERFIRAKYEQKKWVGKGSGPKTADEEPSIRKSPKKKSSSSSSRSRQDRQDRQAIPAAQQQQQPVQAPQQAQNLLFEPVTSSAPVASNAALPSYVNVQQQAPAQQQQQQQQYQQPQMDKDVLMSLYAPSPMAPMHGGQQMPNAHGTGFHGSPNYNVHLPTQQQYQYQQQPQYAMPQQQTMYQQQAPPQQQQQFDHLGQMGQMYAQAQPQQQFYQQPQGYRPGGY